MKYPTAESNGHYHYSYPPLAAVETKIVDFAREHAHTLATAVMSDRSETKRAAAALLLGWAHPAPDNLQVLIGATADPNSQVRDNAARGLAPLARYLSCREDLTVDWSPVISMFIRPSVLDRQKALEVLSVAARTSPRIAAMLKNELKQRILEIATTKLYMHRRMVYAALPYALQESRVLTDVELTEWIQKYHPEDLEWWHREDVRRSYRPLLTDPCALVSGQTRH